MTPIGTNCSESKSTLSNLPAYNDRMNAQGLSALLHPATVAIIGASLEPDSIAREITQSALHDVFAGQLFLVNPKHTVLDHHVCLRNTEELPPDIDLAVVVAPWNSVRAIVKALAQRRCGVVLILSVPKKSTLIWQVAENELAKLRQLILGKPMRLIGPASFGLFLPHERLHLSLSRSAPNAGSVAILTHRPAVLSYLLGEATSEGVGISLALALGQLADVDMADMLDLVAADSASKVVLVHLDAAPAARKLFSALRALAIKKPVVVLANLASAESWRTRAWNSALRRCGVHTASSLDELRLALKLAPLGLTRPIQSLAILTNAPEMATQLRSEFVVAAKLQTPPIAISNSRGNKITTTKTKEIENPFAMSPDSTTQEMSAMVEQVRASNSADLCMLDFEASHFVDGAAFIEQLPAATDDATTLALLSPTVVFRYALSRKSYACFASASDAARAILLQQQIWQAKQSLLQTPEPLLEVPISMAGPVVWWDDLPAGDLPANATERLLAEIGIDIGLSPADPNTTGPVIQFMVDAELGPCITLNEFTVDNLPLSRSRARVLAAVATADAEAEFAVHLPIITRAILKFAELFEADERLRSVTITQLRVASDDQLFAHINIRISPPPRAPFCFAPTPRAIHEQVYRDGLPPMLLRAMRAEDEPKLREAFEGLTPHEVRMRFLHPMKAMTHELAARLSQLDYDRELALMLCTVEPPGQADIFAVVRAGFDPSTRVSEFAIILPKALSRKGLGTLLLQKMISEAQARDMRSIEGDVLMDNDAMLALARKLGFAVAAHGAASGLFRVRLEL
jgi:acetyltransferase